MKRKRSGSFGFPSQMMGRRRVRRKRQVRGRQGAMGIRAARRRRGRPLRLNTRTGGFLGIELKFYDQKLIKSALTAPTDASTGEHNPSDTVSLNTVVQGDGESNRDGRQIVMKKLSVKGVIEVAFKINATLLHNAPIIFIAIVLDRQTNGALLNSEDVFKNPGANAITAASPFNNLQFIKRFQVLKTLQFQVQQQQAVYDGTNIELGGFHRKFEMHVNLRNLTVNYSATTESIANITDNGLNIVAYCSDTTVVPTLSYMSRLRFVG